MNIKTQQEIKDFIESLLGGEVTVRVNDNYVYVEVDKMYEYVECSFTNLLKMVEFFGTDEIDMTCGSSSGGCETCDYGSSYVMEFTIKPKVSV